MKNVIIFLEFISMVLPRGLDPKYYAKDVGTNLSAFSEEAIENSTTQASDGYSFINNFLSSEKVIPETKDPIHEKSSDNLNPKHGELGNDQRTDLKVKEGVSLDRVGEDSSEPEDPRDYSVLFGRADHKGSQSNVQRDGRMENTSPNKMSSDAFMSTFLKTQSSSKSDQNSFPYQKIAKTVSPDKIKLQSQSIDLQEYNQGRQGNDNFVVGNLEDSSQRQRELTPLTPARDRQLLIPFTPVNLDFVEAKYQSLIQELPLLIDEAREVISQDIATKNMMGYTIAASFFIGAFLDTVGVTLLELGSFGELILELVTGKFWPGLYVLFWGYAFGYSGPWLFPTVFNGGDPNLKCSSADYFQLLNDHDLTLNIQSFTELSSGASVILVEKVSRDFNAKLSCIVNQRSNYKEAALAAQAFESMIFLTSLHGQLSDVPPLDQTTRDISLLDSELLNLWAEIVLITDQVYNEVASRKAHTAVVYVFIGFLNVIGTVGGLMMYGSIAETALTPLQPQPVPDTAQVFQDVLQWILSDGVDSHFIRSIGGTLFSLAPLSWGYGYWMTYFLFLESAEPGCGPLDRDDVYSKYIQLSSLRDLLDTGISIPAVKYFLEEWRREMSAGLYCLLSTDEGVILGDSINMFYNFALTRLDLTGLEEV